MNRLDELTHTVAEGHSNLQGGDTKFNGVDGQYGHSASLWLADMERKHREGSSPSTFLKHVVRHLEGEAALWVSNTESILELIYKSHRDTATESDVEAFHCALTQHSKPDFREFKLKVTSTPHYRLMAMK